MLSSSVNTVGNHNIESQIRDKLLKRRIGVIGAGECNEEIYRIAERLGELIAISGAFLYCGGLGGVMEAAAKGARKQSGITIGIIPTSNAKDANPYILIPIVTSLSHMRNFVLVNSCELVFAVSGGYGTLSEIAFSLKLNIPIIGLQTFDFKEIIHVDTPEEAIKKAISILSNF